MEVKVHRDLKMEGPGCWEPGVAWLEKFFYKMWVRKKVQYLILSKIFPFAGQIILFVFVLFYSFIF